MKAHFFVSKDPISIIDFLSAFKLACVSNKIHEDVAMRFLPHYSKNPVANALNICTCAENWLPQFATSVQNERSRSCNLLRSYPELVSYLL